MRRIIEGRIETGFMYHGCSGCYLPEVYFVAMRVSLCLWQVVDDNLQLLLYVGSG